MRLKFEFPTFLILILAIIVAIWVWVDFNSVDSTPTPTVKYPPVFAFYADSNWVEIRNETDNHPDSKYKNVQMIDADDQDGDTLKFEIVNTNPDWDWHIDTGRITYDWIERTDDEGRLITVLNQSLNIRIRTCPLTPSGRYSALVKVTDQLGACDSAWISTDYTNDSFDTHNKNYQDATSN